MNTLYVRIEHTDGSFWFASTLQAAKTADQHVANLNRNAKRYYGTDAATYSLATSEEYWAYRKSHMRSSLLVEA